MVCAGLFELSHQTCLVCDPAIRDFVQRERPTSGLQVQYTLLPFCRSADSYQAVCPAIKDAGLILKNKSASQVRIHSETFSSSYHESPLLV